jgi:hypothetical protein
LSPEPFDNLMAIAVLAFGGGIDGVFVLEGIARDCDLLQDRAALDRISARDSSPVIDLHVRRDLVVVVVIVCRDRGRIRARISTALIRPRPRHTTTITTITETRKVVH